MKKMANQIRFSLPGRIVEMLYCNDEYFREVSKVNKAGTISFPKYNTWKDDDGFHMSFALAGYSPENINVKSIGSELLISGDGIDVDKEVLKEGEPQKANIQRGYIVRGIARRKFEVKFLISNYFDLISAKASMKDGLLHVTIPERKEYTLDVININ